MYFSSTAELKRYIANRTGISADSIHGETKEEIIASARTSLISKESEQSRLATREQFAVALSGEYTNTEAALNELDRIETNVQWSARATDPNDQYQEFFWNLLDQI